MNHAKKIEVNITQIGFVGDRCEYCDKGYVSSLPVDHESVCDICQIGYHKDGNTCQEGAGAGEGFGCA